jgi:hypothetical protein
VLIIPAIDVGGVNTRAVLFDVVDAAKVSRTLARRLTANAPFRDVGRSIGWRWTNSTVTGRVGRSG